MLFAALGDIAGHFDALEAVAGYLEEQGIMVILQTGNLFGGREKAAEIVDFLRERGIVTIQGAADRLLTPRRAGRLDPEDPRREAMTAAHAALRPDQIEWVCGLTWKTRLTYEKLQMILCYGSLTSRGEVLTEETSMMRLQRQRESSPVDIVVCGGAEEPFTRLVDGTLFVGPGALSPELGKARFALISTETTPWKVTFTELDC